MNLMRCSLVVTYLVLAPLSAAAQQPAAQQPAAPGSAQTPTQSSSDLLQPGQLDQLVAPIALYPDTLLAQVLMASTYPLEIVQADRWAKQNKNLKGAALTAAVNKQNWED